jgi:hypothetical protein
VSGKVRNVIIKDKGAGLEPAKRKEFEQFVVFHAEEIARKWVDYFVLKKHISPVIISRRVGNVRAAN